MLMLTAGILLLTATEGALARNGGNSNDRGGMRSGDSSGDRDRGDKLSVKHDDKDRNGDKRAEKHKDKDKTSGTTANNNNTPSGADRKIPIDPGAGGKVPTDPSAGRKIPIDPGTGGKPTPTTTTGGGLPPNDPVGNTKPAAPGSAPGVVTVSNGVTKYDIQNGPGGVAVYSSSPGTITVTNGKESKTLSGGSLTLSGNVVGVGAAQGIQVVAPNGEGKTVVAIKPPAPTDAKPSAPTSPGHVTTGDGSITVTPMDVGKTLDKAFNGVPALIFVPPAAGAYGLAKDGVSGAVNKVEDAAKGLYDFFAW
jgi:hypothetical protein